MENVELGILPSIKFEEETTFIEPSPNKELIAVGVGKSIFIYDKD